jgi:hypothetical protein
VVGDSNTILHKELNMEWATIDIQISRDDIISGVVANSYASVDCPIALGIKKYVKDDVQTYVTDATVIFIRGKKDRARSISKPLRRKNEIFSCILPESAQDFITLFDHYCPTYTFKFKLSLPKGILNESIGYNTILPPRKNKNDNYAKITSS